MSGEVDEGGTMACKYWGMLEGVIGESGRLVGMELVGREGADGSGVSSREEV